jgi:hypothetical protein
MNKHYRRRIVSLVAALAVLVILPLAAAEEPSTTTTVSMLTHFLFSTAVITGVTLAFNQTLVSVVGRGQAE